MAKNFSEIEEEFRNIIDAGEYGRSFEITSGRLLVADPYLLGWTQNEPLLRLFNMPEEKTLSFEGSIQGSQHCHMALFIMLMQIQIMIYI